MKKKLQTLRANKAVDEINPLLAEIGHRYDLDEMCEWMPAANVLSDACNKLQKVHEAVLREHGFTS
jgi:hypothetical protein